MSRSSSGSGLRAGRAGAGCEEVEPDDEPPAGELLGPLVGHECGEVGVAGVCGAGCDGTVRTGSPACGRAELVVPKRARLLFAASQLSPRFGDWLLRRMTSG